VGDPFDCHEGSLCFDESLGEVRGGGDRQSEPEVWPADLALGGQDRLIKMDQS